MGNYPLISVCIITFNHEKFISECLIGVFKQDYPNIEVVISNDFSSDNTHQIILKLISDPILQNRFKIKYFNQEVNLGINPNLRFALEKCTGDYIAVCEGDDYWLSTDKLTKQINSILGTSYDACFHDVKCKKKGSFLDSFINSFSGFSVSEIDIIKLGDLLKSKWLIPTCSFFFKRNILELPEFYNELKWGDFPLFCCIASVSDIYFVKDIDAVYRMDNSSSQINKIDPLGSILFSLDMLRFLIWLKKNVNVPEIDERMLFQMRKSRNVLVSYQNSTVYKSVSIIQRFLVNFYYGLKK